MTVPTVELAQGGPCVSRLTQGLWRLIDWDYQPVELTAFLQGCLELGISTFDHADIYGDYRCEAAFGEVFTRLSVPRDQVQLISKCGICLVSDRKPEFMVKHYNTSKPHILRSVENSLRNLRTDYLDLLLIHRPDPLMRASEVAEAFEQLRAAGKVRYFGVSNFLPRQFELLQSELPFPLVTNQIEYSPLAMHHQQDGTIDLCQQRRIHPMAWSPFGGGDLFNAGLGQCGRLQSVMEDIGHALGGAPIDQVAMAWVLTHPAGFVPVLGTGRLDRVRAAVQAIGLELTRQHWFTIWQASMGCDVP